jgi:hypothetical protein
VSDLLSWLKEYSPGVVALIVIGGVAVWVLKQTVEHAITKSFDAHAKELELGLERRSAFKDKVLTERFTRITELSARLERVMTNLNRLRLGGAAPDGFKKGNEIVPLTEIFEDLNINRLTLTEEFHRLLVRKAKLAHDAANAHDDARWDALGDEWVRLDAELRAAVERAFNLSEIGF